MDEAISTAWIDITDSLSSSFQPSPSRDSKELGETFWTRLKQFAQTQPQLFDILISWYLDCIRKHFVTVVSPKFWSHFSDFKKIKQTSTRTELHKWVDTNLSSAVRETYESVRAFETVISSLGPAQHDVENSHNQPRELLKVVLFTDDTNRSTLQEILFIFFSRHFLKFNKLQKKKLRESENMEDEEEEEGDEEESEENESDEENATMHGTSEQHFDELCVKLHHLDLVSLSEEIFTEILFDQIENHIVKWCKGEFEKPQLPKIQHWANVVLFEWLKLVIRLDDASAQNKDKNYRMFQQWKTRLEFNIYETFANLRIREIFDLIVELEVSTPALLDVQACLRKTNQHSQLVQALKKAHAQRLLHPGTQTQTIIELYISTIKAMRILDPTSVLLEEVAEPIRNYLRQREDTIRRIVEGITNDESELFEEFRRGKTRLDRDDDDDDDDEEATAPEAGDSDEPNVPKQWNPDPMEATPNKRRHRQQDTISMLYGSSELFVNEYRNVLADKLIEIKDYNVDNEIRNLELLKLRFDETSLHNCEIMLKDMTDSKRINTLINTNMQKEKDQSNEPPNDDEFRFDATIVSRLYWPTFKEESVTLPSVAKAQIEKYCKAYEQVKRPRQLVHKPHLGSVTLELEMEDGTREFVVSPAHAAIIWLFQDDNKTVPLDTIATQTGMSREAARKKLVYWIQNRVLVESEKDVFQLVEDSSAAGKQPTQSVEEVEVVEVQAPSAVPAHLVMMENYVLHMLINRGKMSLAMMHSTLSMMLGSAFGSTSTADLKSFLAKLAGEDKIEIDGSEYAAKK